MKKTQEKAMKSDQQALSNNNRTSNYMSYMLFEGKQEIVIEHDGQDYRLRITRQNKLILTK